MTSPALRRPDRLNRDDARARHERLQRDSSGVDEIETIGIRSFLKDLLLHAEAHFRSAFVQQGK